MGGGRAQGVLFLSREDRGDGRTREIVVDGWEGWLPGKFVHNMLGYRMILHLLSLQ